MGFISSKIYQQKRSGSCSSLRHRHRVEGTFLAIPPPNGVRNSFYKSRTTHTRDFVVVVLFLTAYDDDDDDEVAAAMVLYGRVVAFVGCNLFLTSSKNELFSRAHCLHRTLVMSFIFNNLFTLFLDTLYVYNYG